MAGSVVTRSSVCGWQISTDQHGTPTDLARIAYRGDRYRFETTLARPTVPPG